MHTDLSIASLILGASLLVKMVMLALLLSSVASWTLVFKKRRELIAAKRAAASFEDQFWAADDLTALFNRLSNQRSPADGTQRMFERVLG